MSETKILASLTNSLTCCYLWLFLWIDSKLNIISFLTRPLLPDPYPISLQDTWICSLTCLHLSGFFLSLVTSVQTSGRCSLPQQVLPWMTRSYWCHFPFQNPQCLLSVFKLDSKFLSLALWSHHSLTSISSRQFSLFPYVHCFCSYQAGWHRVPW